MNQNNKKIMTEEQNDLFLELICFIDMYHTIKDNPINELSENINETKINLVLEFLTENKISSECLQLETYNQILNWFKSNILNIKPLAFSDGFNIYSKYGEMFSINLEYKYTEFELIQKGYDVVEWSK